VHVSDAPGARAEIALQQDTAVRKESVTVTSGPFDTVDSNPASEKSLSKSEIQALAMVLVGDPMRAAQALPGVTSDNDFRAEFVVRGADYEHVGVCGERPSHCLRFAISKPAARPRARGGNLGTAAHRQRPYRMDLLQISQNELHRPAGSTPVSAAISIKATP